MPTISIGRDHLFEALGETYTQDQFEELCFDFGIELDDVTTEKAIIRKERHLDEAATEDEEIIYKIEVPANRYDLLCLEGLAQALRIFLGKDDIPAFKVRELTDGSMLKMHVKHETSLIRPYIVCAVLRGISFNEARYNSFIDLQDKLHQNLCRRRTLVAIGTHDLDTLQGPFTYEALPPPDIKFVPLKQEKEFRADELIEFYRSDLKLKAYLHIIENSPVFPVIYDCKRTVLSLPPIINGAHSAITLNTRNVFIECTATDLTKAKIVLNTMVTMFSRYCESKFEAEPVEVIYPGGKSAIYPDLSTWDLEVDASYICSSVGIVVEENEILNLLRKMQLPARTKDSKILVSVPPTRSDVLHKCDIMEDVAIAFGFNNILKTKPRSLTQGFQQPLNHFSDLLRLEVAMAGFTEVLTWILCSSKENFCMINRRDDGKTAVVIANPRTSDFEVVRTSLLPGILKTTGHNKDHPRPIKIFEVGDVVILDEKKEVGACNQRRLAALYCNSNSGFEVIHGLVDRIMEVVNVPFVSVGDDSGYYIRPSHEPEFFPGRQANIIFRGKSVGAFGIVHPEVLACFDIPDPCSMVEINIEPLL
eukprot:TRINITY_DN4694_c0_g2_i1.p1 TRINITY_DN4694_c0_g2~~TRINITY_DN4694_c0_g2_i1.p1  ORF type:complete len:591 (+),score=130.08 TRINITY_DN4694_c0_g2_i1:313-2085(+)